MDLNFKKLVSPSLKSLFVGEMSDMIISGRLKAGDRLPPERELCGKMGVSRAVVNGGIKELARCGFLEVVPRKGVFVADFRRYGTMDTLEYILEYNEGKFDAEMLDSLYEVRSCIERHIAALAAQRRTDEDIAELRACVDAVSTADDIASLGEAVHEFYHTLALASKNLIYPLNIQAYRPVYVSLTGALVEQLSREERAEKLNELVDHIERRDSEAADACIVRICEWGQSKSSLLTKND